MSTQTLPARPGPSVSAPARGSSLTGPLALGIIFTLCAALRVFHLGAASLWSDEIFSRYYENVFGLRFLLTEGLSKEPTPPTYYLLLSGWAALWGSSEAALRSLSAVAGILCTVPTYWLGRELAGKAQASAAALLFALCPIAIYFAQEARVYALFMLAASVVLWATAVLQRDMRSRKATGLYLLFATLCLYLHATGLLFVVACAAAVGLSLLGRRTLPQGQPAGLLRWALLNVIVLLLGTPLFLHTLTASHSSGLDWMPKAGMHQLVYCMAQLVSGQLTPYPAPGLPAGIAVLAALAVSLLAHRRDHGFARPAAVTLLFVPGVYVALVLIVSLARPILLPRTLAWIAVPLCVLGGMQLLKAGRARVALALCLAAGFGAGLYFQLTTRTSNKEPWREITQQYQDPLQQADLVVLSPVSDPMVLVYYAPGLKHVRLWNAGLQPSIMTAAADRLHIEPITEAEIQEQIQTGHSVWIVAHSFDLDRVNALRSRVPSTLFRVWACGKAPCVALAGWQPRR